MARPGMDRGGSTIDLRPAEGYRFEPSEEYLRAKAIHMMSAVVKTNQKQWIIPKEQVLELIFFRNVFSALAAYEKARGLVVTRASNNNDGEDSLGECVSLVAFQVAFERLFFVLRDPKAFPPSFNADQYDEDEDGFIEWGDFFRVWQRTNMTINLSLVERIFLTLDNADSSHLAYACSNGVLLVIIVSSSCFVLGTLPQCHQKHGICNVFKGIETACLVIFILEYVLRVCTVWGVRIEVFDKDALLKIVTGFEPIHLHSPLARLWNFVITRSNLIDLCAILPGVVAMGFNAEGGAFVILRLVRLSRLLRAFKSPALSEAVMLIKRTLEQSTKALYILAFNLLLGVVIAGSLMYMMEGGNELQSIGLGGVWNNETHSFWRQTGWKWEWDNASDVGDWMPIMDESPYQSIPHACWWAMVTVTTVGYGDDYSSSPTTFMGKVIGLLVMLFSFVILALPVGVIGGNFGAVWDEHLESKRKRGNKIHSETDFVAYEIAKLNPRSMMNVMLIEVWDDRHGVPICDGCVPPFPTFMGEAQITLNLPENEPSSANIPLTLSPNPAIANRGVQGSITLRVDWTPTSYEPNKGNPQNQTRRTVSSCASTSITAKQLKEVLEDVNLTGTLQVTIVSAENLLNLDIGGGRGQSSPFCTVLCYPRNKMKQGCPRAAVWCTPTEKKTLSPQWEVSHSFDFDWSIHAKVAPALEFSQAPEPDHVGDASPVSNRRKASDFSDAMGVSQVQQLLSVIRDLGSKLQDQKSASRRVQEEMQVLTERIDQVVGRQTAQLSGTLRPSDGDGRYSRGGSEALSFRLPTPTGSTS